jgi:hypothetical protein
LPIIFVKLLSLILKSIARNAKKSSNDFDRFDTGKGYWVKVHNERTTRGETKGELTPIKTGLITSSTSILADEVFIIYTSCIFNSINIIAYHIC